MHSIAKIVNSDFEIVFSRAKKRKLGFAESPIFELSVWCGFRVATVNPFCGSVLNAIVAVRISFDGLH